MEQSSRKKVLSFKGSGSALRVTFFRAFSQTFSIMLMPVPSMARQNVTPSKPCHTFLPL